MSSITKFQFRNNKLTSKFYLKKILKFFISKIFLQAFELTKTDILKFLNKKTYLA